MARLKCPPSADTVLEWISHLELYMCGQACFPHSNHPQAALPRRIAAVPCVTCRPNPGIPKIERECGEGQTDRSSGTM